MEVEGGFFMVFEVQLVYLRASIAREEKSAGKSIVISLYDEGGR